MDLLTFVLGFGAGALVTIMAMCAGIVLTLIQIDKDR